MDNEKSTIVALLHDVIEDTNVTIKDIILLCFDNDIINATETLTHNRNDDYMTYINKIKNNPLAKTVKIADLKHNSDLSRLKKITDKDLLRVKKYEKALCIL